jgi:protein-S-isoprenylcysteine O-methyltransferase Ste14
VEKGTSYVQTTKLVTSGVYAVVRHPQYLAGMLLNVALPLVGQHWLVATLGVPPFVLTLVDARLADRAALEKFGEGYRRYMKEVPGLNFLSGIVRWLTRIRRNSCQKKN